MTEVQRAILIAVGELSPNAYGAAIAESTGLSIASIYSELDSLQDQYFVGSKVEPGGAERGYKHKLLWSLTPVGRAAIRRLSAGPEKESKNAND